MKITFVASTTHAHTLNLLLWIICQSHALALLDKHPIVHSSHIRFIKFFMGSFFCFFFNDTATTEIYTLSLHDALPI